MRLLRCHIESFGTLHERDFDFSAGLNALVAPNGAGKTTFTAFIRAMLYGFPRASKDLEKDLKRKYTPWQGGRFGGWLEFELDGCSYRLERFFSPDSLKIYELPLLAPCRKFGSDPGRAIFGIDADSFERSCFMGQLSEAGTLATDSIRGRLGELVEGGGIGFDKAYKTLREARSELQAYRGSGGRIPELDRKIAANQIELDNCESASAQLVSLRGKMRENEELASELETQLDSCEQSIDEAQRRESLQLLFERREELCTDKEALCADMEELSGRYPEGLPDAETPPKALPTRFVLLILAAVAALAAGAVLIVLKMYIPGGVLCALALPLFFLWLRQTKKLTAENDRLLKTYADAVKLSAMQKELARLDEELAALEERLPAEQPLPGKTGAAELRLICEELDGQLDGLRRRQYDLHAQELRLAGQAERASALQSVLSRQREERKTAADRMRQLDLAMELLQKSRDSLAAGYMERIKTGFAGYMAMLTADSPERIFVDRDLNVSLERGGMARQLEYFSAGFSDIVMLCMRLALTDALFLDEQPFIIMDDPFTALDDENLKRALGLIRSLGEQRQILYLTCSSSRL